MIFLRPGQILDEVEMQGKAGIMAKFEIVLQKELKSIGLIVERLPKALRTKKE